MISVFLGLLSWRQMRIIWCQRSSNHKASSHSCFPLLTFHISAVDPDVDLEGLGAVVETGATASNTDRFSEPAPACTYDH